MESFRPLFAGTTDKTNTYIHTRAHINLYNTVMYCEYRHKHSGNCCFTLVLLLFLFNKSGLIKRKMERTETKKRKKKTTKREMDLWKRFNNSQSIYIDPIDCLAMFTLSSSNPYYALAVAFSSFSDRINNNGMVIFKGFRLAFCE